MERNFNWQMPIFVCHW